SPSRRQISSGAMSESAYTGLRKPPSTQLAALRSSERFGLRQCRRADTFAEARGDELAVARVDLAAQPATAERLAGHVPRSRSAERIPHQIADGAGGSDETPHQLQGLLRRVLGFLTHAVGQRGHLDYVARFCTERIRAPDVTTVTVAGASRLRMDRIAQ